MSLAGGEGAANDPTVEIRERLAAVPSDPHAADRATLQLELYQIQYRVPETRENTAHRAQLVRLHSEARADVRHAANSVDRTERALEGAREALRNAQAAELDAGAAIEMFDRDYGSAE